MADAGVDARGPEGLGRQRGCRGHDPRWGSKERIFPEAEDLMRSVLVKGFS